MGKTADLLPGTLDLLRRAARGPAVAGASRTLTVLTAGIVIGLVAALVTTNLVSAFLFGLSPRDPFTLVASILVLLATGVIAGAVPARRAASVDPIRVLKTE
jgi:ABC-type antimicrobial peptide transport system permease subunit